MLAVIWSAPVLCQLYLAKLATALAVDAGRANLARGGSSSVSADCL